MTPDQIQLVLSAAQKIVSTTRGVLDYLPMMAPVVAAALGWLAAYLQFRASFRKGLEKEHYYASKQNVLEIVRLQTVFTRCLYDFYKSVKNSFSYATPLKRDFLTDFETGYDSQLAEIHLLRRIEFPESTFDDKPILQQMKQLVAHISAMNETIVSALHRMEEDPSESSPPIPQEDANRFSRESAKLINSVCQEVALQENIMVKILSNEAKRLGLVTVMPTVHREKLRPIETPDDMSAAPTTPKGNK